MKALHLSEIMLPHRLMEEVRRMARRSTRRDCPEAVGVGEEDMPIVRVLRD